MLLVERHYLLTYGGGFTENFYGLKRERVLRIKGGELPRAQKGAPQIVRDTLTLSEKDVWKNLAVMVGLPYLKRKLDESYEIHAPPATILGPRYNRDVLPTNATVRQRLLHYYKWFLRNIYPSVSAAYHFSLLAFNLAYLFDRTKHHSPFLWLIGTRMRRLNEADHRAIAQNTQAKPSPLRPPARPGQSISIFSPRTFTTSIYPQLLSSLRFLLPTSIFALKFLEWWHASDFARQLSRKVIEGLELPPPIISGLPPPPPAAPKPKQPPSPSSSTPLLADPDSITSKEAPPSRRPRREQPPISASSNLPILTVFLAPESSSATCPICLSSIVNPTACQTGYVFCYTCIFRWVDGSHERQMAFLDGAADAEERWAEEEGSRRGRWESGKGRCPVTGRRVLGGTDGLRRIMV